MIRRDLLRFGAAAAALAVPCRLLAGRVPSRPMIVLHDEHSAQARAFAAAASASGATVLATGRDVAALRHDGASRLGDGLPLAGLTTYADMLIAADIAAEDRRRMTMRAIHRPVPGNGTLHGIEIGPEQLAPLLRTAGSGWPTALWATMSGARPEGAAFLSARRLDAIGDRRVTLWSWVVS